MQALTTVSHEHDGRLLQYVDRLDVLAGRLDTEPPAAIKDDLADVYRGLTTLLVPHMEAVEAAVHPTLERLLQDTGAMAPMAREHGEIRRLIAVVGEAVDHPARLGSQGEVFALRRALLRLYALLKTHLAEESLYLPILEHNLSPDQELELAKALDHVSSQEL